MHESESSAATPNEDDQQASEADEQALDPLIIDESEIMENETDEILTPDIRSNGASMLTELECPDCKFVTTDEIRYRKHVRCHQNSAPRACKRCEFTSIYSWNMDRHMKSHGASGKFICYRCNFSQNSRQAMQFHVENHHSVQMRNAESQTDAEMGFEELVEIDTESFIFEVHAFKVNENYDEENQRNLILLDEKAGVQRMSSGRLSVLSAASDQIDGLAVGLHSQQPRRQMTLDELALNANRAKSLPKYMSEHEVIETPSEPANIKEYEKDPDVKQRTCSVCGYQGKWISEMVRHKRVHTNERPFKCKYCSRTSKWKADLIRHVAKAHGVRVVSKYSRSRTFDSDSQKMRAFKEAHGYLESGIDSNSAIQELPVDGDHDESFESIPEVRVETPELSPITSPVPTTPNSLKEFLSERQQANPQYAVLVKYLDVLSGNSGEPILRCRQCSYETHDLHTFRAHTQKHENKKPYQCSTCGYRSNWSSDVHKHIRLKKIGHEKAYVIRLHPEVQSPISRPDSPESNASVGEKSLPTILMKLPVSSVLKCAKCDFFGEAKSPEVVVNHLEKMHNLPAFGCRDCNFTSSSRKTLIFHAQTIHNCSDLEIIKENLITVELGSCNGSDSGFSSGKRSSNSDAESVPEQKRFKFAEILHQRPEGQRKLFKCPRCPFDSIDFMEFEAHNIGHGQQTAPFMYQCVFCDWMASIKPKIFQHLKLHTGDPERHMALVEKRFLNGSIAVAVAGTLQSPPADAKSFRCELCPFATEVPQYFEYHRLVHSMQAAMGFPFGFLSFSTPAATGISSGLMLPGNPAAAALMMPNGNEILKAHASLIAKAGCPQTGANSTLGALSSVTAAKDVLLSEFNEIVDATESQMLPAAGASLVKSGK